MLSSSRHPKILLSALVNAWLGIISPLSAQETLPDGYTYEIGAVPLSTPGVLLDNSSGLHADNLLVLNGTLLRADETGTAAEVAPSLKGGGEEFFFARSEGRVILGADSTSPRSDIFRMLIVVPNQDYNEAAFLETLPGEPKAQASSNRVKVWYLDALGRAASWNLGCYTFNLPPSKGGTVLSHQPNGQSCQKTRDTALALDPGARDQGSYWIMARDPTGVLTPVLVLQPSDAPIDFQQSREAGRITTTAHQSVEAGIAWSFFRVQGLDENERLVVNFFGIDGDGQKELVPIEHRDFVTFFEEISSPVAFTLPDNHLLVALPENQAKYAGLEYTFAGDGRYDCEPFSAATESVARSLEDARLSLIDVACIARKLEFTVLHDLQHSIIARVKDGTSLDVSEGKQCASSGIGISLSDHRTATCVTGAEPGDEVTILAETAGFEIDSASHVITEENAFGGVLQFTPLVRLEDRYLAIAVDVEGDIDAAAIDWASVIEVTGASVEDVTIARQDPTGFILRLRFGKDYQEIWRATEEIVLLFTLDDPSIELSIVEATIGGGDGQIGVPIERMVSRMELPAQKGPIADSELVLLPRISLSGASVTLPQEFSLQLKMPSDEGTAFPNQFCDVGLSVSNSGIVWLAWNPRGGIPVFGWLPVEEHPWLEGMEFSSDEIVELFARPSEDPIFATSTNIQKMSEGVCPNPDTPFAITTVGAIDSGIISVRPNLLLTYFLRSVATDRLYGDRRTVHISRLEPLAALAKQRLIEVRFLESSGSFRSIFPPNRNRPMPTFEANTLYNETKAPSLTPSFALILRDADARRRMYGYVDSWPPIVLISSNWDQTGCEEIGRRIASTVRAENLGSPIGMTVYVLDDRVADGDAPLDKEAERQSCTLGEAPNTLQVTHVTTWRDSVLDERGLRTDFSAIYGDVFSGLASSNGN